MVDIKLITQTIALGRAIEPEGAALVEQAILSLSKSKGNVDYATALERYASFFKDIAGFESNHQQLIVQAFLFAVARHHHQFYQWHNNTQLPYAYHLASTAKHVLSFAHARPATVIIALWHDILEDKKATPEEIFEKLKTYSLFKEKDDILTALILLDRGQYKGKQKTHLYYKHICTHSDALLVKSADLLANLHACLARFGEMLEDKSRFWIYSYIFQIEHCLFLLPEFSSSPYSSLVKKKLAGIISLMHGRFHEKEQKEYQSFVAEVTS